MGRAENSRKTPADMAHVLHEQSGDLDSVQRKHRIEGGKQIVRIENRDRPAASQFRDQSARGLRRQRMRHRLVESIAADRVAEGFDVQRHGGTVLFMRRVSPAA